MSVQSEFLKSLFDELTARGISEDVARDNVTKFQSQLKKKAELDGNDKIDAALSKIPPASIAENIYNMLKAEDDSEAGARSEVVVIDTDSDTVTKTVKEGKNVSKKEDSSENEDTLEENAEDDVSEDSAPEEEAPKENEEAQENAGVVLDIPDDDPSIEYKEPSEDPNEDAVNSMNEEEASEDASESEEAEETDNAENSEEESENSENEENTEDTENTENTENTEDGESTENAEDVETDGEVSEQNFENTEDTEDSENTEAEEVNTDEVKKNSEITEEKNDDTEASDTDEENDDDLKVFRKPGEGDELSEYEPNNRRRVHNAGVNSAAQTPPGERKTVRRTAEAVDLFDDDTKKKNSWLFYVFAVILFPLVFFIGAAVFGVFLFLWLAIAVLSVLLIIAVVLLAAAGSLAAICGLLFGLVELIGGNTAAAMFEFGLALTVGSCVLFVGILIYNLAVRFLPFIIKKLFALLILIFKIFGKMFKKFKQICSTL